MTDQTKLGQFDRTIRNCRVVEIPAGATPKYITVRLPGTDGSLVDAWWSGSPALAVNDYCKLLRQPDTPQYEVVGASGATAALPAVHTHGADEITVDTASFAGNLSAADDTVQKALDTLDDMSGGGGWPFAKTLTVSTTDPDAGYATIAAAITGASAGDTILLDSETYTITGSALSVSKALTIVGQSQNQTIITSALSNSPSVDVTADNVTFRNLTIQHTGTGTTAGALSTDNANLTLDNVYLDKTSGASTTSYGLWMYGGSVTLKNGTRISCTAGTNKYGIMNDTASATVTVYGGQIGGDKADIYGSQSGSILTVYDPALTNGYTDWAGDVNGQYHGTKLVTNASGATAPGCDVGYIDANGDYVTTTTANYFGGNCVVVVSGGNGLKCFVATSGRWPMRYAGSAPSDGDFLVTSTTAGAAGAQTTMRPEIFARCQAAGSGGQVSALLLTATLPVLAVAANDIYYVAGHSSTDFTATLNGAPSATQFVYNTPSAGNANNLVPTGTLLGNLVVFNTTRGTARLVTACNTGTKTVTNVSVSDAWANGDTVTIVSPTIGGTVAEIDLSSASALAAIPALARGLKLVCFKYDSGAGGQSSYVHPVEAFAGSKAIPWYGAAAGAYNGEVLDIPLIGRRFGFNSTGSGTGTATDIIDLAGYYLAVP